MTSAKSVGNARDATTDPFAGSVVAVVTPFDRHDRIDEDMVAAHLAFLWDQGADKVLVNGTTGEFFSLMPAERRALLSVARRAFPGTLLYQAGADSLGQTLEQVAWAVEAAADAVVVIAPYYFASAPSEGIAAWYQAVARAASIPMIIYNFPRHTGNGITASQLERIPHFGMKDSSADLSLVNATPRYWIGGDSKILAMHQAGGAGFVSAHSNYLPSLYTAMEKALASGDSGAAVELQSTITRLSRALSGPAQIGMAKYAVGKRVAGYPDRVRLPLLEASREERQTVDQLLGSTECGRWSAQTCS